MPEMTTNFSRANAEFGEDGLHGGENGVVAAAGAPANFLVGLKIFFCVDAAKWPWSFHILLKVLQGRISRAVPRFCASISDCLNGLP